MADDFDWKPENEDVIVPEQRATAVYTNRWGQAVIRQERGAMDDEDTWIIVNRDNLPDVIRALSAIVDGPDQRQTEPDEPERPRTATTGNLVVLNEQIAHDARGEHSRATE